MNCSNGTFDDIIKRYAGLLASVDAWFSHCLAVAGPSIACRSGCSECCRGLFDITLLDAFYLKRGFDLLEHPVRQEVLVKVRERLRRLQNVWNDFDQPYILNVRPEEEWDELMPDEDETPCPLLDSGGRCLVYDYRPMTCRLHGAPLVDMSGEVMHDEWCTKNFNGEDPLTRPDLRGEFDRIFGQEVEIFRVFTTQLLNHEMSELDTFVPTALLIDFSAFDWVSWKEMCRLVINKPV